MIHRRWLLALFLPCLAITSPAVADFAGKVVGVSDGDTITVLRDRTQVRIRLYGVDCPETGQDFGSRAKQFTSELAFGKIVKVMPRATDRYPMFGVKSSSARRGSRGFPLFSGVC